MGHPDTPSVGIIGCGFVGGSALNGFKYYTDVKVYDKYKKNLDPIEKVVRQDVLFVCVPTPQSEEGDCDVSIVREAIHSVTQFSDWDITKPVIIKSTIPPGFAGELQREHPLLEIIHSPEFLTERIAGLDFATQTRVIIGIDHPGASRVVFELFLKCFKGIQIEKCSWDAAALVKYGVNCFFATKITFMNELSQICKSYGVDATDVLWLMQNDGRIARHHMEVPGHDGKLGYGGACFPKDTAALIAIAKKTGIDPKVLKAVVEKNNEVRGTES